MERVDIIIQQLKSWEVGYLAPSAQMLMKEAREMLEEQRRQIINLTAKAEAAPKKRAKKIDG
jgi:sulfur relay (sulfurtransferase) DsrC/TusE family protein